MSKDRQSEAPSTLHHLCDRLLFGFFTSVLVVTPFVYQKYMDASVAFRRPKETAFQVLCILIVATWLVKFLEAGKFSTLESLLTLRGWVELLKRTPYAAPFLMMAIACLLSWMNAGNQSYFWETTLSVFGAICICFILIEQLENNYKRFLVLLTLIALATSFMGAYCMLQYYGKDPLFQPRKAEYEGRTIASGFIDNPNTVSGYLVTALPLVLSIFFFARRLWIKIPALIGSIAIFGGLLSACTRGAILAGVFALGVFILLTFLKSTYTRSEKKIIAIGSALIIAFIAFYVYINPYIYNRIANMESVLNLRTNTRYIEWASGKRMMQDHFLVGLGLGNFKYYYLDYRGDAARETEFVGRWEKANQAHNEYVQVAAELGSVGLFAMFWVIGTFSWFVLSRAIKTKLRISRFLRLQAGDYVKKEMTPELMADELSEDDVRLEQRRVNLLNGFLGGLLGLAGHCAFMFPLHIVPSAVLGVYILAMGYSFARMPRSSLALGSGSERAGAKSQSKRGKRR